MITYLHRHLFDPEKLALLCVLWLGAACGGNRPMPAGDPYETGRLVSQNGRCVPERTGGTVLAENLTLVSMITEVVILPEGRFAVVSEGATPQVIVYDAEGRQERVLGSKGRGPYQYESVPGAAAHDGNVVVFDGGGLKFIEYSLTGEPLREITGPTESIDRFHFTPSGQIVMYRKGGGDGGAGCSRAASLSLPTDSSSSRRPSTAPWSLSVRDSFLRDSVDPIFRRRRRYSEETIDRGRCL